MINRDISGCTHTQVDLIRGGGLIYVINVKWFEGPQCEVVIIQLKLLDQRWCHVTDSNIGAVTWVTNVFIRLAISFGGAITT